MLHAHLVLLTQYRRPVFTGSMLTLCEQTMRSACAQCDVEMAEFNGEADHAHLLVAYPPTPAISTLMQRRNGRTAHPVRREFTGRCVRARMRGPLWSPSSFAVSCAGAPPSIINQYTDGPTRPCKRRVVPGDEQDGLTPDQGPGLAPNKVPVNSFHCRGGDGPRPPGAQRRKQRRPRPRAAAATARRRPRATRPKDRRTAPRSR